VSANFYRVANVTNIAEQTSTQTQGTRKSADVRRKEIVTIAQRAFAEGGLNGTSTEAIAAEAGISQPYLFRLFGTKRELFLAVCDRCIARTREAFERGAEAPAWETPLEGMGRAYVDLMTSDRHLLLGQMQMYAACGDPEIRATVRENFGGLVRFVKERSGASQEEVRQFFASGMLINVATALDLPAIASDAAWARDLLGPSGFPC